MSEESRKTTEELTIQAWGARLAEARESISYSQEQVASELNLPKGYITILERGGLDGLPSIVFARGYIRNYARLLCLDAEALIVEYEQLHGIQTTKGQIRTIGKDHQQVKVSHPVMKLTTGAILLALIGVLVWWWQAQYGNALELPSFHDGPQVQIPKGEAPVASDQDDLSKLALLALDDSESEVLAENKPDLLEPQKTEDAPEFVADLVSEGLREEVQPLMEGENSENQNVLASVGVASAVENVQEVVPAAETNLSVVAEEISREPMANSDQKQTDSGLVSISATFSDKCWVEIKDVDNRKLFLNLATEGQSINVSGKPPLSVLIGAAHALDSFSFNDEKMDLSQYNRKNVIRIKLPLDQ